MTMPLHGFARASLVLAQVDERGIGSEWWPGAVLAIFLAALWLTCHRRARRGTHAQSRGESR